MKKKGMTLIESVVTIAILGVIFLLVTPLIRSFGGVDNRVKTQKEIDSEFLVVNEFIQKKVKAAKSSSSTSYARIYLYEKNDGEGNLIPFYDKDTFDFSANEIIDGTEGNILFLEIPEDDGNITDNFFYLNGSKLGYQKDSNFEIIMENIEEATFRFDKGIVVYYINLDIKDSEGKFHDSLRGSASTRIDFD